MNDATFLLESHVMQAEDATTPLRQLYFAAQTMLIESRPGCAARAIYDGIRDGLLVTTGEPVLRDGLAPPPTPWSRATPVRRPEADPRALSPRGRPDGRRGGARRAGAEPGPERACPRNRRPPSGPRERAAVRPPPRPAVPFPALPARDPEA